MIKQAQARLQICAVMTGAITGLVKRSFKEKMLFSVMWRFTIITLSILLVRIFWEMMIKVNTLTL